MLKILAGMIPQDMGTIKYADDLRLVYFDQHREYIPAELTLKEALCPAGEMVNYRGQFIHVNGWAADSDSAIGTEAVTELDRLCREAALKFPRSVFFAGKLIFEQESWFQRFLHNETAAAVERRLQFAGLPMIIMPIRMFHS